MNKTLKVISGILLVSLMALGISSKYETPKNEALEVRDVLTEEINKPITGKIIRRAAEEAPAAEMKISNVVKAQVSVEENEKRSIRFVAGIDSYLYDSASIKLTMPNIDKEFVIPVTTAYESVIANGEVVTAEEAFGKGYNYLIAGTLNNVPKAYWANDIVADATINKGEEVATATTTRTINTLVELDKEEIAKPDPVLYLFGAATGGWDVAVQLPETEEGVFSGLVNLNTSNEGFVITETDVLSDKTKFCLHDEKGNNFSVAYAGEYELTVTWNDMSNDSTWKVAKEVNGNEKGDAYYKLVPQFEIIVPEVVTIEKLYLNGDAVGNWDTYVELNKITDTLFQLTEQTLSSASFVVTAQKSRGAGDIVIKLPGGGNLSGSEGAGRYNISISLEEQDGTWTLIKDSNGNYKENVYIKIEFIPNEKVNATQNGLATAEASSVNGSKTAAKAIDGDLGDTKRWESTQKVDPQWIIIDLGEEVEINGIDIQWYGGASAKTYTIEVSTDKESWDLLKDVTNASTTRNRLDEHSFEARTVRYIKVYGSSRVGDYGYSIDELYVWKA